MSYVHHDGQTALAVCGCGRLHLTYGPITLNFQRDEFVKFARDVDGWPPTSPINWYRSELPVTGLPDATKRAGSSYGSQSSRGSEQCGSQ